MHSSYIIIKQKYKLKFCANGLLFYANGKAHTKRALALRTLFLYVFMRTGIILPVRIYRKGGRWSECRESTLRRFR